jgi:hypothetical protein
MEYERDLGRTNDDELHQSLIVQKIQRKVQIQRSLHEGYRLLIKYTMK